MNPPAPQPLYLPGEPDVAFATLHLPAANTVRATAVVLCPPFGWEEVCSYRSLRFWALRLAEAGYPAIRVSLPSTGDSGGGPRDPERVRAWTAAIRSAAVALRNQTGARRIAAVGITLGGVLAYLAAAEEAPIDDLVLWGVPARPRTLVRELRAVSKLERARFFEGLEAPPLPAAGEIEAGGFVLSASTVSELEQLDLRAIELPPARGRRVLLLERDGLAIDTALRDTVERTGAVLTVAPGEGFGKMTSHPRYARPPLAVIERVQSWLDSGSAPLVGAPRSKPVHSAGMSNAEIQLGDGNVVRETPIWIEQPFGRLAAVLAEPVVKPHHGLGAVLMNAGAVRRIGPNRMWVEAARRWAAGGVPTLRLDFEGFGDADGDEIRYHGNDSAIYAPVFLSQVLGALDYLQERGIGDRFVLGGLSAGATWALQGALRDSRVCAALMLNLQMVTYDPGLSPARDLRALVSEPFSLSRLRRAATGPRLRAFVRWMLATPLRWLKRMASGESSTAATGQELDRALNGLLASNKRALWIFSDHEPLYDELVRSGWEGRLAGSPHITFAHIAVRDHTMRASWCQRQVHAALDRAVEFELEQSPAPTVPAADVIVPRERSQPPSSTWWPEVEGL
ncbi:MAG: alpha/beta fold hydrolase [Solirubrobacteraceae bacterium]